MCKYLHDVTPVQRGFPTVSVYQMLFPCRPPFFTISTTPQVQPSLAPLSLMDYGSLNKPLRTLYLIPSVVPGSEEDLERQKQRVLYIQSYMQGNIQVECDFTAEATFPDHWCQWVEDKMKKSDFIGLLWTNTTGRFVHTNTPSSIEWTNFPENGREYLTGYSIKLLYEKLYTATDALSRTWSFLITFEEDLIDRTKIPLVLGRQPLFVIRSTDSLRYFSSCLRGNSRLPKPARRVGRSADLLVPKAVETEALKPAIPELETGRSGWRKYKVSPSITLGII